MSKSRKSRLVAPRRALAIESLEQRVVFASDALLAANDVYHAVPDQPFESAAPGVFANDTLTEGSKALLFTDAAHGHVELHQDGSFEYQPKAGFTGLDSFLYLASDGASSSNLAAVSLLVEHPQSPPAAVNDAYSTSEDARLDISAELGVLANDTDADGDAIAASLVSGPQHGDLVLQEDGSLTYVPSANFNGLDGFSYVAKDATGQSQVATVTIEVAAVNDAPVASNDEFTTDEDSPLAIDLPGILANDTDADTLTATLDAGPQNGSVTVNPDGSFVYTPNANFHGVDGFSYVASDGTAESDVASVTINVKAVNDAPVANDDEFTIDEDTPLTIDPAGVLANDTDVDGDSLTASLVEGPANGAVTLNADGSFTYTPNANFHGVDGFRYVAGDGTAESDVASVTVNVNSVNDAPVAADDAFTVNAGSSLSVGPAGVLANDTDVDGDSLTASLVEGPKSGAVTLNADGSFSYKPAAGFSGDDSFTYQASDGTGASNTATVSITVNPAVVINQRPEARNDRFTLTAGETLEVSAPGLLANDSDPEGAALKASLFTGPQNGTLALSGDGSFNYQPNDGFSGRDSFLYSVSDGELNSALAAVTLYVLPAPPATTPPAAAAVPTGIVCEANPAPTCHQPVADSHGHFASDQFRVRLGIIHERMIDMLFAAQAMRHEAHHVAHHIDHVMSHGHWWR